MSYGSWLSDPDETATPAPLVGGRPTRAQLVRQMLEIRGPMTTTAIADELGLSNGHAWHVCVEAWELGVREFAKGKAGRPSTWWVPGWRR